jgi:beta-phosphoglucomutase-like phosphatase (HAD superfamily)
MPSSSNAAGPELGVMPRHTVVIEDSTNGIRAGKAAGMAVIAIPDPTYPPDQAALGIADLALDSIAELTVERVRRWMDSGH